MAASGSKLDVDALMKNKVVPTYLTQLGQSLLDINTAIIDANIFLRGQEKSAEEKAAEEKGPEEKGAKEKSPWAGLREINSPRCFDAAGKMAPLPGDEKEEKEGMGFPGDKGKIKRVQDAMKSFCSESRLTDKDKFILVCVNFQAAQATSETHLMASLARYQAKQSQDVQLASLTFEAVQLQVLRVLAQAGPAAYNATLTELSKPEEVSKILKGAKDELAFGLNLKKCLTELEVYRKAYFTKKCASFTKSAKSKEGKGEISPQAVEAEVKADTKYQRIEAAILALKTYPLNHDLNQLMAKAHSLYEEEKRREKAGIFKHPLQSHLKKLHTAVATQFKQRPPIPELASPTASPSSGAGVSPEVDSPAFRPGGGSPKSV